MSNQEVDRLEVIQQTTAGQLTQQQASERLHLSVRQIKRLVKRYREKGAQGLISRHRGKPSNNAIAAAVKRDALVLIKSTYADFSPTFAHEKLTEQHDLSFSVETLRKWMVDAPIWQSKSVKKARVHPSRPRRACRGERVQIDGSPHLWFEDRGEPCTLIVFA